MQIDTATSSDIDAILALQTQIYRTDTPAPNSKEVLEKQLEDTSCDVLVLRVDDKVVGTASIYYLDVAIRGKRIAYLEGLVVDKAQRGKGLGTSLFEKCVEIAKDKNCYKMIFTSGFDREDAHKFYEKLGFKKWGFEFRMDL
ncbi:MAG: GNAT family N-acetyltransferase [Candidatus Curtissbacteria bacterium]|nr:GNAT family N-acetyltransferase [Candidatus Curtissbacteria bacterium]